MKRFAALILFLIYFVTSTGATMRFHFCMGEMINYSLWQNKEKKCGKCGMEMKETGDSGCCKDEVKWIKIKDDQKANTVHFEFQNLHIEAICFLLLNTNLFASQNFNLLPESNTPLRSHEVGIYLLNSIFRI